MGWGHEPLNSAVTSFPNNTLSYIYFLRCQKDFAGIRRYIDFSQDRGYLLEY